MKYFCWLICEGVIKGRNIKIILNFFLVHNTSSVVESSTMEKLIFTLVNSGKLVPFLYLDYLFLYTSVGRQCSFRQNCGLT